MIGGRNWMLVGAVLVGGVVGGLLAQAVTGRTAHAGEGAAREIRASAIVLVDAQGREIGEFAATAAGPTLVLKDAEGRPRIALGNGEGDEGYWGLFCRDGEGIERFVCGARADGKGSGLGVWDWNGELRIGMGADEGGCGFTLKNELGVQRVGIGVGARGGGDFTLHDGEGKSIWRASRQIRED
ncbi:MAG: hypothetical protein PVJ27_07275 [Candidatus Brocadiaceae bacterium]|jgi:hypothetical protein